MTFEEEFPSLKGINEKHSYNLLSERQKQLITEFCLDKQRVKEAIEELLKNMPIYEGYENALDDLKKELGLE